MSIETVEWITFNSFMSDDGAVCYQEDVNYTAARIIVRGREVFSPSSDLEAVYKNFMSRYARHAEAIEKKH